jgi:exonuclease III
VGGWGAVGIGMPIVALRPLRLCSINVRGRVEARLAALLTTFINESSFDVICLLETMRTDDVLGADGYQAFHCNRMRVSDHGGITVLVRQGICAQLVQQPDPRVGIVWLDMPAYNLAVAACYFSPPGSAHYATGVLAPDPYGIMFHGVRDAQLRNRACLVMGDFNVRIGRECADVPPAADAQSVPPDMAAAMHDLDALYQGIPPGRCSRDGFVFTGQGGLARDFLAGMLGTNLVVLNGRHQGDVDGEYTYENYARDGLLTGASVIDLAVVSARLYDRVARFCVHPFDDTLSGDHRLLEVVLSLPAAADADAQGALNTGSRRQRGRRTLRPGWACLNFIAALEAYEPRCVAVREDIQAGNCSAAEAVGRLSDVLRAAYADAYSGVASLPSAERRRHRPRGAPWWDADCTVAKQSFRPIRAAHRADPLDGQLYVAAEAARRSYNAMLARKKAAWEKAEQERHLAIYFSRDQHVFWRDFLGMLSAPCHITNIDEWTTWFQALMSQALPAQLTASPQDAARVAGQPSTSGPAAAPSALPPAHQALKQQLHDQHVRQPGDGHACLNDPAGVPEVRAIMAALRLRKAADPEGLTCDMFRIAASPPPRDDGVAAGGDAASAGRPDEQPGGPIVNDAPVAPNLVACMAALMDQLVQEPGDLPEPMQLSKLIPVLKPGGDPSNKDCYKGICVSSVFSRVFESWLGRRLDHLAETEHMRAISQCGFRRKHGSVDALFTLQHLIARARYQRQCLYVVFVDFRKAFDSVQRQHMLQRCRQLGVHGPFLHALERVYDNVMLQAHVAGQCGDVFATACGTKQGSELSPLLFGLFIEQLHELIQLKLPGAGPVLGHLHVPDLLYADDVALLALNDPHQAQQLLDCLDVFCQLFDMEVNLAPTKTCAVVFRSRGTDIPMDFHPTFRGQAVPVEESYKYLGLVLHATDDIRVTANALATTSTRAMHALLSKLKAAHLTQFDIRCRMFDILVTSVMSYGCQVWGPFLVHKPQPRGQPAHRPRIVPPYANFADKLHLSFLRMMAGAGRCVSHEVLMRDFGRRAISWHWIKLATRWWCRMRAMDEHKLARHAFLADIALMLEGCKDCWTYAFLCVLTHLGVVTRQQWCPGSVPPGTDASSVAGITGIDEASVVHAIHDANMQAWSDAVDVDPADPQAPSQGFDKLVHANWVCPVVPSHLLAQCAGPKPPHMHLRAPFHQLQCLARYRVGWHRLRIRMGRQAGEPRAARVCLLCGMLHRPNQPVEHLRHFLLECPLYHHIREDYHELFAPAARSFNTAADHMLYIFDTPGHQWQLLKCLNRMTNRREHCMGSGRANGGPDAPLAGYIPSAGLVALEATV